MFCTTECWDCEDKNCEHYRSKHDLYFENKKLKGVIETYEILIKANNINNWNELKKWLKDNIEHVEWTSLSEDYLTGLEDTLKKMQELEGNNDKR